MPDGRWDVAYEHPSDQTPVPVAVLTGGNVRLITGKRLIKDVVPRLRAVVIVRSGYPGESWDLPLAKPQVQAECPQAKPRTYDLEVRRATAIPGDERPAWGQKPPVPCHQI